eukprot:6180802-Pleurochrysis_carterae.AAC.2
MNDSHASIVQRACQFSASVCQWVGESVRELWNKRQRGVEESKREQVSSPANWCKRGYVLIMRVQPSLSMTSRH